MYRPAAQELASLGAVASRWVVDEVTADRLERFTAARVLQELPIPAARRELPALLAHDDPRLVEAAALALAGRPPDAAMVPALEEAIERFASDADSWPVYLVASALDRAAPGPESARRILGLARGRTDDLRHELYALVHLRAPELLTDPERLDHLLGRGLVEIDQGPGVFEVEVSRPDTLEPYLRLQDLAFLEARRDPLCDRLLSDLEERGSRLAAILLAWFGDRRALPELRRRLLSESDTYGWETSFPTLYSEGEHRGYHAYSQAIEHLTGQPLEDAVRLTLLEQAGLARRADGTALMVLHRLAPQVARAKVFERFRVARGQGSCRVAGNTIHEHGFLAAGTPISEALELLGPPDRTTEDAAYYCCVPAEWAGDFRLRHSAGWVVAFESEYRDTDRREGWCPP